MIQDNFWLKIFLIEVAWLRPGVKSEGILPYNDQCTINFCPVEKLSGSIFLSLTPFFMQYMLTILKIEVS